MQIVYLSARPDVFRDTVRQVEHFMTFVGEVVVVCPAALQPRFTGATHLPLSLIADEELLPDNPGSSSDHQARNFLLRATLIDRSLVAEAFIMADDDARPMGPVPDSVFREDGRHRAYYFYDLQYWPSQKTSFDIGQHNTFKLLSRRGYPHLSYAAHMPQVIDRECYRACLEAFRDALGERPRYDEWSLYFNFAQREFPDRYHPPSPYRTFCWPDAPFAWPMYVEPGALLFENYYPGLYLDKAVFAGLSSAPPPDTAARIAREKITRWADLTAARRSGRLSLADPWVRGSRLRWLAARLARPLVARRIQARQRLPDR